MSIWSSGNTEFLTLNFIYEQSMIDKTSNNIDFSQTIPLLPLRDVVVFPNMVIPLFVGRPKSIKALEDAMEGGKSIVLAAQKDASLEEPVEEVINGFLHL